MSQQKKIDLAEMIAEEFGANAAYVQGLLERFRSNPALVDDSWRAYFSELTGDAVEVGPASGNGLKAAVSKNESDGAAATGKSQLQQSPNRKQNQASHQLLPQTPR